MKFQNPCPEDYEKPALKMSRSEKMLQSPELMSRFSTYIVIQQQATGSNSRRSNLLFAR
jgi:hypothetical protein